MMDTYVSMTVVSESEQSSREAIEQAFAAIESFGNRINFYSDKSELAMINRSAGTEGVSVSTETLDIIDKAVFVADASSGAFDPTIGPLMQLWNFHNPVKPRPEDIKSRLPLVNYRHVSIDKDRDVVMLKEKNMLLDLGGIAKGYATDIAVDVLKKNGISSGLVAIAGDIRAFGSKPGGKPWNIGIRNPRQKNRSDEIIAKMQLTDKAISTSGDYERFFIQDGVRYHHLLNPGTGFPATTCRSVSIIADKGVFADAFSTAVFVLGPEKGMDLIKKMNMEAVIIDNNGTIYTTEALKGKLNFEKID
ncbi:MAG: FAD:protein FMN transferase [Nitrospiraceae bacterium]|nr:MAG: FAD:protein FMN transferase [Nitrospiraceae bacterium]